MTTYVSHSSSVSSRMKTKNAKDLKYRLLVQKYEINRRLYKAIASNMNLPLILRREAFIQLRLLPISSSETRIKNRCIYSGRSKSVLKYFRLSRLSFREAARQGLLPGVFKSSW